MMIPHCMMLDVLDPYPLVLRRPTPPIPPKSQIELWFEEELAKLKAQRDTGKLPIVETPGKTREVLEVTPTGRIRSMSQALERSSWRHQIADNISKTNPLMQKMIHLQAQEAAERAMQAQNMSGLQQLQWRGQAMFEEQVGANLARAEERVMQSLAREEGWTEWQMPQQKESPTKTRHTPVTVCNDYEWNTTSYPPREPGDYIASRSKDPVWARHWDGRRWSLAWYVGHMKDWAAIARRNDSSMKKPPIRSQKAPRLAPLQGAIPWLPGRID